MKLTRPTKFRLAGVVLFSFLLISWSPPTSDFIVDITTAANPNDTDGVTNASNNRYVTAFRGVVVGTGNKVGTGNTTGYSIVVGNGNAGNAYHSVVAGDQNIFADSNPSPGLGTSARMMGIFGKGNNIGLQNDSTLVTGSANAVNANISLVAGYDNAVTGSPSTAITYYSAAIGVSNTVTAGTGWAFGRDNLVTSTNGVAIGTGSRAGNANSTALGRWNSTMASNDVLVVGTGTTDTSRSTALRVTSDGGVILGRAQGDVSMGIYGN